MSESRFPHLGATGNARMVDVSEKAVTARSATAAGRVLLSTDCVAALRDGAVPKGDALAVARIAGIQGRRRLPISSRCAIRCSSVASMSRPR